MILKLSAKSKKGKERLKRWGELWKVIENTNSDQSSWLLTALFDLNQSMAGNGDSTRWVKKVDDPDFNTILFCRDSDEYIKSIYSVVNYGNN